MTSLQADLKRSEIIALIRDMLLAHHAMGRDLEDVIAYMERVIARREKGEARND